MLNRTRNLVRRMAPLPAIALLAAVLSAQSYGPGDLDQAFERDVMILSAARHACHRFDIWLALTDEQQRRGLMFVRRLPADAGMLFVYRAPGRRSMWMKNTFLPLDMLFIRNDGTVSSIVADTVPQSLTSIASEEPVTFVLELNAGTSARLGIEPGSQMYWFNVP
ncbi:MAG: DUF192 domain-containing protein [Gammaproteobacteria bacterium]|nr:DUF192 domain-containing protein [Gammaproteobacteria bacterium]MDH4255126.1 DUF192 domain-containing protein [Gammaproteobacteria bacterium]MDH5310805.1 DUF192 domain-containing protein [Gammaproteobacteria bacterium]